LFQIKVKKKLGKWNCVVNYYVRFVSYDFWEQTTVLSSIKNHLTRPCSGRAKRCAPLMVIVIIGYFRKIILLILLILYH